MPKRAKDQKLIAYFKRCPYPVTLAYLFGSVARGETTPLSDLDVAVYLDEPDRARRVRMYLPLLADLKRAVEDGKVDLVYLNDAPPTLAYQMIAGRRLYSADERQRVAVETRILGDYFDERALERIRHRLLGARILAGKMGERSEEMIDERTIHERLDYINAMLTHLKRYQALSREEFEADEGRYHAALYELQTCIEAMTDIGNHLIAALGLRKPKDRGEIPLIIAEAGIIDKPLAQCLTQAVGMRNLIVHGYLDLILEAVYQTIQENLGDIEAFCRSIIRYLASVSD